MSRFWFRLGKAIKVMCCPDLWRGVRFGCYAALEHELLLRRLNPITVVDVGANVGQFALAARHALPRAEIWSFEPLPRPAAVFSQVFAGDPAARLIPVALGAQAGVAEMYVSAREDSSSLLPIGPEQVRIFPGTGPIGRCPVTVERLDQVIDKADLIAPALLKIDVQGTELDVLRGCGDRLTAFEHLLIEASFLPLYSGQILAAEVIASLADQGFILDGVHNLVTSRSGEAVQADLLFRRRDVLAPNQSRVPADDGKDTSSQAILTDVKRTRVDVWHSLLWSRYKGAVFTEIHAMSRGHNFDVRFIHVAETDNIRSTLTEIDLKYHQYPYTLLFPALYEKIGIVRRAIAVMWATLCSDADLVVLVGYHNIDSWLQLIATKLRNKEAIVCCESTINDRKQRYFRGLLKRIFFRSVDGILCYGIRSQDYTLHYGARPSRLFQPCQAAALPSDYSPSQAYARRLALAPPPRTPRYLYVGRLSQEKGLRTLVDAFARVKRQNPAALLTLVGDGPERGALTAHVLRLNLQDSVLFSGSRNDTELVEHYLESTCLVLPSLSEPWGLVVNEALSYGCPAVTSQICGCVPELIVEGQTGFSFVTGDAFDLAQKMSTALSQFANIERTAATCIELMRKYTPKIAAHNILMGIETVRSG